MMAVLSSAKIGGAAWCENAESSQREPTFMRLSLIAYRICLEASQSECDEYFLDMASDSRKYTDQTVQYCRVGEERIA